MKPLETGRISLRIMTGASEAVFDWTLGRPTASSIMDEHLHINKNLQSHTFE